MTVNPQQEASREEKCPRCGSDYKPTKKLVQMYTNEGYVKYCDHDWHKGSATVQTPAEKLPDFAQTEAKHGIPKWVEVAWRKESERANYNAEAAADNLKALQECQKALAGALSDVVMLRAELSDAKYEIKDLKRGGMSWEDATCGDTEV